MHDHRRGVSSANPRAASPHERLGSGGDTERKDRYHRRDTEGSRHQATDLCVFLVKPLAPTT